MWILLASAGMDCAIGIWIFVIIDVAGSRAAVVIHCLVATQEVSASSSQPQNE